MIAEDDVFSAILAKADGLRQALADKVDANLSDAVLQTRSGALRASIRSALEGDGSALTVDVASTGVPYAAIQEYGGRTAAHEIVAIKAKALHFVGAGGSIFAAHVHHPGSTIPARSYLGSALAELRGEIVEGLKAAALEALGTS